MAKVKIKFIDFTKEFKEHKGEFNLAIQNVLTSGWYILGQEVSDFEKEFANYLGSKYCIGVGNGLEALQISLMAAGIGKRDEVITTPISAIATTLAILAVGAKPVFVDVTSSGLLDPQKIEHAITPQTKAIIPVHLYGQPIDLDFFVKICQKNNLLLLEDACQAHGSSFQGKKLGTFGKLGCFSFYPTKNLGAFGDGGAIITDDDKLADLCRKIRDYGQEDKYLHTVYGLNSRLDEIQAAILRVKLKYLDQNNKKRQKLAKRYKENLQGINAIEIIKPISWEENNFHLFVIKTERRDELQQFLISNGIITLIHYPITIPDQPCLKKEYGKIKIPKAREFVNQVLSLPCNPLMSEDDIDFVSKKIKNFFTT